MKLNPSNNIRDREFKNINFTEDNNIITKEEKQYAIQLCDGGFYTREAKYLNIDESLTMYVYRGIKIKTTYNNVDSENIYFYVFDFQDSKQNIILTVEDKEIVINKDNRYGILDTIEDNLVQEINFTLSYYGNSNNYLYK
jgi:hypothetical protein